MKIPGEPEPTFGRFLNMKDLKTKYKDRTVRLRILTPADEFCTGFIKFGADKKPVRIRDGESFPDVEWGPGLDGKEQLSRRFWACAVYNHAVGAEQVFEFTQASIYYALGALLDDDDWGDLTGYDIKLRSAGELKDTEYSVLPVGKAPMPPSVAESWKALKSSWLGLEALFDGKDPFDTLPF